MGAATSVDCQNAPDPLEVFWISERWSIFSSFQFQHSQAVDESRGSVPVAAAALISVGAEETESESEEHKRHRKNGSSESESQL